MSRSSLLWALLGPVLTSHTLSPSCGLRISSLTFPGLHVCCSFGRCSVNPCWINRLLARSRAELFCRFSFGSLAMSGLWTGLLKLMEGRGGKKNPGLSNHMNHYLYWIRHFWFPSCISDWVPECMSSACPGWAFSKEPTFRRICSGCFLSSDPTVSWIPTSWISRYWFQN